MRMFYLNLQEIQEILDDLVKEYASAPTSVRNTAYIIIRKIKRKIVNKVKEKHDNR